MRYTTSVPLSGDQETDTQGEDPLKRKPIGRRLPCKAARSPSKPVDKFTTPPMSVNTRAQFVVGAQSEVLPKQVQSVGPVWQLELSWLHPAGEQKVQGPSGCSGQLCCWGTQRSVVSGVDRLQDLGGNACLGPPIFHSRCLFHVIRCILSAYWATFPAKCFA